MSIENILYGIAIESFVVAAALEFNLFEVSAIQQFVHGIIILVITIVIILYKERKLMK